MRIFRSSSLKHLNCSIIINSSSLNDDAGELLVVVLWVVVAGVSLTIISADALFVRVSSSRERQ